MEALNVSGPVVTVGDSLYKLMCVFKLSISVGAVMIKVGRHVSFKMPRE